MKTILIIEDEVAISRVLAAYVKKAGYRPVRAATGTEAIAAFDCDKPDLVLLDLMLPDADGMELLAAIRERGACPVIMLTARDGISDRLAGLNEGADDYMVKPFVPEEVVARINAVLRRPVHWNDRHGKRIYGNLLIDLAAKQVLVNGAEVALNPRELTLLLFLAERPNRTFSREQLIEQVWGMDYEGSDRAVDLSIKRLRQALSHWSGDEGEIRTLRGMGYQLWIKE
ncbi:response regulator transcription factor [Paenibacillus apis]|uniref:DNA-binding response regulator n=1 Tax=Paenibacillus apis TaxID=1792174 RepID=A0A919Y2R4_9BACL|nr:response regulator transcription factor [Paenibacillus apis]GIO41045.1 DNA-binding response regulator [Paenibacillus apis]